MDTTEDMTTEEWEAFIEEAFPREDVKPIPPQPPLTFLPEGEQVDHVDPDHYARWPIQPKEFIVRNGMEFWRGNIIKYASRAGFKQYPNMTLVESEIADLEKVKRYADMRLNQLNGETIL